MPGDEQKGAGGMFGIIKQIGHPSKVITVKLVLRYFTAPVSFVSFSLSFILGREG